MKRVPLGKTTPSLADILEQDQAAEALESGNQISEKGNKKSDIAKLKSDIGKPISDIGSPKTDLGNPISEKPGPEVGNPISEIVDQKPVSKADYEKITATLEPALFWKLEEERKRRRVLKLEYTYSEIIRDALTAFFEQQEPKQEG